MITQEDDLHMMEHTETWPIYPVLPVKNYKIVPRGKAPAHGVFFADDKKAIVYRGIPLDQLGVAATTRPMADNPHALLYEAEMTATKDVVKKLLERAEKTDYGTFAEAIKAGWVVD